jgi:hypothetical protein
MGGMIDAQVRAAAPSGFEYWRIGDGHALLLKASEVYASVVFCRGRVMAARRILNADSDWLPAIDRATREHGQPQVITTTTPWSGPGGGNVTSVVLRWEEASIQFDISNSPERRDGKGSLRQNGAASLSFVDLTNLCRGS